MFLPTQLQNPLFLDLYVHPICGIYTYTIPNFSVFILIDILIILSDTCFTSSILFFISLFSIKATQYLHLLFPLQKGLYPSHSPFSPCPLHFISLRPRTSNFLSFIISINSSTLFDYVSVFNFPNLSLWKFCLFHSSETYFCFWK